MAATLTPEQSLGLLFIPVLAGIGRAERQVVGGAVEKRKKLRNFDGNEIEEIARIASRAMQTKEY